VERELIRHKGGPLLFDTLSGNQGETPPVSNQKSHDIDNEICTLDELMAFHIRRTLDKTSGKIHGPGGAAELLGLKSTTLRAKMDRLGIMYGRKDRIL